MRILVVSDPFLDKDRIRNELSGLCESDSLTFCNSFHTAKDFITNNVVKSQSPLDLIISYSIIGGESADEFRNWIRYDCERTYSKRDFNLWKIPIALVVDISQNKNVFNGYDCMIDDIGLEKLNLFVPEFSLVIKYWRKAVLDELDDLGIQFNSGIIDYSYYFSGKRKQYIVTKILSDNFKLFPRKLNYYWLDFNTEQIEKSIDTFVKMLKRSERIGSKGEEKAYHKFFRTNSSFLLRDNYSRFWYESKLFKNDTKYEEPDFVLKPNLSYQTDLSVLEVKLPNETFLKKKPYHNSPKAKLIDHIIQVNDYKDYLESDEYKTALNSVFGYVPQRPNYSLLIGREVIKNQCVDDLSRIMRQLGQGQLNLMTYDELMNYQVKFLCRMNIIDIK